MRLGGSGAYLATVNTAAEAAEGAAYGLEHNLPVVMIGGGSNIIWPDSGYSGLVLVNKIMGYELDEKDSETVYLNLGAGEPWDSVVARTVMAGLSGIEQLSLIPGSAGGTPIQNVGAYGRETSEVLVSLTAYDREAKQMVTIPVADCEFAYRTSRFKTKDKNRFFITGLTLHLSRTTPMPPFYPAVQAYLDDNKINQPSVQNIRDAVVAIRSAKLPDPSKVANCGSFFANPVISTDEFNTLKHQWTDLPNWPLEDGKVKLSAAWLIEQAGLKDYHDPQTGMATWAKQPLVFVNEHAKNTADLLAFKQKVVDKVKSVFGVELEQEPELVGEPEPHITHSQEVDYS